MPINYVLHSFLEVILETTRHEVIFHGFQEVISECQVISNDRAVMSVVQMIQNGRKYITYNLYHTIIQLLMYVSVGMKCY